MELEGTAFPRGPAPLLRAQRATHGKKEGGGEGGKKKKGKKSEKKKKRESLGKELWSPGQVCVLARSLERIKPVIALCLLSSWLLCHRPPPGAQGPAGTALAGGGTEGGPRSGSRGTLSPSPPGSTQRGHLCPAPLRLTPWIFLPFTEKEIFFFLSLPHR